MGTKQGSTATHWRPGTTPGSRWKVEKFAPNIHKIAIEAASRDMLGQKFLLSGDRHHDNSHCNQAMEMEHLKEARRQNAIIRLWRAMRGKQAMKYTLHESAHAACPHMSEEDVVILSTAQADILWKCGYRAPPKENRSA